MLTTILWVGAFFIVLLWALMHPPGPGGRTPG